MAIDWLLKELASRFNSTTVQKMIAAFRNNPLLWRELEQNALPARWLEFAGSHAERWHPAIISLFLLDESLVDKDLSNLLTPLPQELQSNADKTLETIRSTGLDPASLKDAALMAISLRGFRASHADWKGLVPFMIAGKARLTAWQSSLPILVKVVPDFEAALEELVSGVNDLQGSEMAKTLISSLKSLPITENEQFDLLVRILNRATLHFQVQLLTRLQGEVSDSFIKLLASSLLVQKESSLNEDDVESFRDLAALHQFAGQNQKAREALDGAFKAINRNQAAILQKIALELERADPEESRKTWEEVMRLAPENNDYRNQYAEFLIQQDEVEFAVDLLDQVEDESTNAIFALRYPQLREKSGEIHAALDNALQRKTLSTKSSRFGFKKDNLKAAEYAFEQKHYKTAAEFVRKALQEDPNDLTAIRLAALVNQRLANLEDAIESISLLSLFEPENKGNKKDLARLYLQTKQELKALEIYEQLIDSSQEPNREDLLTYSEIAIKASRPELAIPLAENFLSRDQLDGEALVILCKALITSDQKKRAVEMLERASEVAPEKPASWLSLAKIWTELGETEKATQALRKARAALPGDPQILRALGTLYLQNEQTTDAIAALKQAHALEPQNLEVRKALAGALLKQGYVDDAWTILADLEDDYASDPELALVLGQTNLALDEPVNARPLLQFAWNSLHREDTLLAYATCLLELNKQRPNVNQKELEILLDGLLANQDKLRQDFDLALLATDLNAAIGNDNAAYESYLQLLDSPQAKSPRAYHHLQLQLGKTALKLGFDDVSLASLQEALLVKPDDLETRQMLARAYLISGSEEDAFSTARAALQIAPADLENVLWFSDFMSENHNEKEAIQVIRDAIHLRPEEKTLYLTLARTHALVGDMAETKNTLNRMLEIEEISTEEYVDIANLYLQLKLTEEAAAIIQRAISGNPSPDFQEALDLVYSILRLGDHAAALRLTYELESSLGSHPCYPVLLSDVLTANMQFLPALEQISSMVQELEFGSETECLSTQTQMKNHAGFHAYSATGLYLRAIQLERTTGDLNAAQKHADLAQKLDPSNQELQQEQAALALATRNEKKLEGILDYLTSQPHSHAQTVPVVRLLTLDALIQQDYPKVAMLRQHLIEDQPEDAFTYAVQAALAQQAAELNEANRLLEQSMQAIEEEAISHNETSFDINRHFEWVWSCLACGVAAWETNRWQIANQCFSSALSVVRINPVVNQLLAKYLTDNYRQHNNAMLLNITKHLPQLFNSENQSESMEEQIAVAGRFLKPAQLLADLKIGQAVFHGHWDDDNRMSQLVNSGRQAAQVLSVLVNPDRISAIMNAFADDPEVLTQSAIINLHTDPEYSSSVARHLLEKSATDPILNAIDAFANQDLPQQAAKKMEAALEAWPDEPEWHAFAGRMFQNAGLYPQAASHLEEALRISPKTAHNWQLLGDIKLLEKDYHAAKDYFGKASDLSPENPETLDSLAKINQRLGEHQIAIQCWQKAAQLKPENPEYYLSIAESHMARREFELAMRGISLALNKNPDHPKALLLKARAEIDADNPALARHTITAAKSVVADELPFDLLSIDLDRQTNPHGALKALQSLAANNPDNPQVLNQLADYLIDAGQLEKAEKNLLNSLSINPDKPATLISLGKVDRLKGNLDQAVDRLSTAISLDPSLIEAYLELGQTYQDRREVNDAIDTYLQAIDMVGKDPRPYLQAAAAYKESRDYRNSETMLRQAAQLSPSDQSIRRQLASMVALNLVNNLQEAPKRK